MKKIFISTTCLFLLSSCFFGEKEELDLPKSPLMEQEINQEIIRKENQEKKEKLQKDLSQSIDNFLEQE